LLSGSFLSAYHSGIQQEGNSVMSDGIEKVRKFLGQITELGLLLVALAIVAQILFGEAVPFIGGNVTGNLIALIKSLGDGGLVGLIAVAIIFWLFSKRNPG
jgi:hypothetical protein